MNKTPLEQLLGSSHSDPGCDGALEVIDQYVEAVRRGEDAAERFASFVTHIRNCAACREDTEGLLAVVQGLEAEGEGPAKS